MCIWRAPLRTRLALPEITTDYNSVLSHDAYPRCHRRTQRQRAVAIIRAMAVEHARENRTGVWIATGATSTGSTARWQEVATARNGTASAAIYRSPENLRTAKTQTSRHLRHLRHHVVHMTEGAATCLAANLMTDLVAPESLTR